MCCGIYTGEKQFIVFGDSPPATFERYQVKCLHSTVWLTLSAAILSACSILIPGRDGTKHYLVIGTGLVSVYEPPESSIVITDVTALGISISDQPGLKFGVGYSSSFAVTVPDNAEDVRAEITRKFCGPIVVNIPSATLRNYSSQGEVKKDGEK